MDTDAILRRRPQAVVVDEFPHTNVPGSGRDKRWEDVHVLLDDGIDVLTTMNVQHLESLNDQIWQSTGVRVRETIPDWVLQAGGRSGDGRSDAARAAQPAEARRRLSPDKAQKALENFFREPTLVALRELAMRQTAHAVESRQSDDAAAFSELAADLPASAERVLLLIEPDPSSAALIRRARRVADYLHADCLAVYVGARADMSDLDPEQRDTLERQLNFARALQIDTRMLEGSDAAATLVNFARINGVTQIFVTRRDTGRLTGIFRRGPGAAHRRHSPRTCR